MKHQLLKRAAARLAALGTMHVERPSLALPRTVFGVWIRRYPLSVGRQANLVTYRGQSIVQVNAALAFPAAARAAARGVFYILRDRPTVAVIEADGFYWNSDTDPDVIAERAARRAEGSVIERWGLRG